MAPEAEVELGFRTLPEALRYWSRVRPEGLALSQGAEELSYRDLAAVVRELGERLAGAGVGPGDRLAVLGPNTVEWVAAFLAGLQLGAVVVPLNSRLSSLELLRQIELSSPRAALAAETLLTVLERAGRSAGLRPLALERGAGARSVWRLPRSTGAGRGPVPPAAPALISFTSGTTGLPKGAVISHDALVRSASAFVPHLETSSGDSTVALVPLFHNTGFADQLTQMTLVGGALDLLPEFGVAGAFEALARRPATYFIAVPSIYRLLMLHASADTAFRSVRVAVYGGASMPTGWIEELAARWPRLQLFNCYGLTEFTSLSHLLPPEHALVRSDSVGRPVEGVRQRIADERGRPLPPGEIGEIQIAGPMRMAGYWRAEQATREAFQGEWLRTGDLGTIDREDFLVLLGRSADVINRGGEKIHAAQVEAALSQLPSVAEAAVVGAPHPIFHERVIACVVVRAGHGFDEEAARSFLAERVPDYAIPERFLIVDELPRNAAGKFDRPRIRAAVAEAVGEEER